MKKNKIIQKIHISSEKITNFCLKNHILTFALFGSILTKNFQETSDIDVLVQFDPQHIPGLIRLAELEIEIEEIFGRKIDLRTPNELSRFFRDEVIAKAYYIYGEKPPLLS